jgi:hypothetical protein
VPLALPVQRCSAHWLAGECGELNWQASCVGLAVPRSATVALARGLIAARGFSDFSIFVQVSNLTAGDRVIGFQVEAIGSQPIWLLRGRNLPE